VLALLARLALAAAEPPPAAPASGYGAFLVETLLILGAVCLLIWIVVRFGLRRLYGGEPPGGLLKVVARLPLEPRRTLYVVSAAGKTLLVGAAESGPLAVLAELDGEKVAELTAKAPPRAGLLDRLLGRSGR
jgi:flagellar protein FliO/FliZ